MRRTVITRTHEAVKAIALCHNVTPVYEEVEAEEGDDTLSEADQQCQQRVTYQAASPDEVSGSRSRDNYLKQHNEAEIIKKSRPK